MNYLGKNYALCKVNKKGCSFDARGKKRKANMTELEGARCLLW
jgi:hypothetical protein